MSVTTAAFWILSIASVVTSIDVPSGKVTSTLITSPSIGGKKLNFNHPPPMRPMLISKIKMKIDNVYATVFYYSLGVLFMAIIFFPNDFIIPNAYYCIGLLYYIIVSYCIIIYIYIYMYKIKSRPLFEMPTGF